MHFKKYRNPVVLSCFCLNHRYHTSTSRERHSSKEEWPHLYSSRVFWSQSHTRRTFDVISLTRVTLLLTCEMTEWMSLWISDISRVTARFWTLLWTNRLGIVKNDKTDKETVMHHSWYQLPFNNSPTKPSTWMQQPLRSSIRLTGRAHVHMRSACDSGSVWSGRGSKAAVAEAKKSICINNEAAERAGGHEAVSRSWSGHINKDGSRDCAGEAGRVCCEWPPITLLRFSDM